MSIIMQNTPSPPIQISLSSEYLSVQSLPMLKRYSFIYRFTLHNHSDQPWQLTHQQWQVRDKDSTLVQERHEQGIAGQLPWITPQTCFQATVALQIPAPVADLTGELRFSSPSSENYFLRSPVVVLDFDPQEVR